MGFFFDKEMGFLFPEINHFNPTELSKKCQCGLKKVRDLGELTPHKIKDHKTNKNHKDGSAPVPAPDIKDKKGGGFAGIISKFASKGTKLGSKLSTQAKKFDLDKTLAKIDTASQVIGQVQQAVGQIQQQGEELQQLKNQIKTLPLQVAMPLVQQQIRKYN